MKVSYHSGKFGGDKHSGSGNIIVFVCHVTMQDHVSVIWLYGLELLEKSHHPTMFGILRHCGNGGIIVSDCHVILQDHMIKG